MEESKRKTQKLTDDTKLAKNKMKKEIILKQKQLLETKKKENLQLKDKEKEVLSIKMSMN